MPTLKPLFHKLSILAFTLLTLAVSGNVSSQQNYQLNFDIQGFNGVTISNPTILNENPNSSQHTGTTLITISPNIAEDVTITISTNSPQCTPSVTTIVIPGSTTPGVSNATVDFTAINDGILEPTGNVCLITYTLTSTNPSYNGTSTATIPITDWNPTTAIVTNTLDENPAALNHSQPVRITLSEEPSAPVTFLITYDTTQITLNTNTITLDSTNWNSGVTVITTAIYDHIQEPSPLNTTLTLTASGSSAAEFANKIYSALVPVNDFTPSIPVIVRTGATTIMPMLGFASFILLLTYFFAQTNRE